MKKKLLIIISIAAFLLVALTVLGFMVFSGNELDCGRAVICHNGEVVFVDEDGTFWKMNSSDLSRGQISKLKTGDKITVLRSTAMADSYPGQCTVRLCFKTASGDESDIGQSVLDELVNIGWLEEPLIGGADKLPDGEKEDGATTADQLVRLINSRSDFPIDLLRILSAEEVYECEADQVDDRIYITMYEAVEVDYEDRGELEEYEWSFTLIPDPQTEGRWLVVEIYTDSPYSKVAGVAAGEGIEEIRETLESMALAVSVDGNTLTAKSQGVTLSYTVNGATDVEISVKVKIDEKTDEE